LETTHHKAVGRCGQPSILFQQFGGHGQLGPRTREHPENTDGEARLLNLQHGCRPDVAHYHNRSPDRHLSRPAEVVVLGPSSSLTQSADEPLDSASTAGLPPSSLLSHSPASLARSLEAFVQPELLPDCESWVCEKCRKRQEATKQLSIRRLPPLLTFHIKRFEHWTSAGTGAGSGVLSEVMSGDRRFRFIG
jgi:hypothetical protein